MRQKRETKKQEKEDVFRGRRSWMKIRLNSWFTRATVNRTHLAVNFFENPSCQTQPRFASREQQTDLFWYETKLDLYIALFWCVSNFICLWLVGASCLYLAILGRFLFFEIVDTWYLEIPPWVHTYAMSHTLRKHGPLKDSYISYEGVRIVLLPCSFTRVYIYIYIYTMSYIWVIPTSAQQKKPKRYTPENYPWTYENRTPGFPEIPPETPSLRWIFGESRFFHTPGIRFAGWIYEKLTTPPGKLSINNGTSPFFIGDTSTQMVGFSIVMWVFGGVFLRGLVVKGQRNGAGEICVSSPRYIHKIAELYPWVIQRCLQGEPPTQATKTNRWLMHFSLIFSFFMAPDASFWIYTPEI